MLFAQVVQTNGSEVNWNNEFDLRNVKAFFIDQETRMILVRDIFTYYYCMCTLYIWVLVCTFSKRRYNADVYR